VTAEWRLPLPAAGFHAQGAAAGAGFLIVAALTAAVRAGRIPRAGLPAVLGLVAVAALVFGWRQVDTYRKRAYRYPEGGPVEAFQWGRRVSHTRIAIAGFYSQYPLYGVDLNNYVQFVGRPELRGALAPIATCVAWRRAIDAGHFQYVVTAPIGAQIGQDVLRRVAGTLHDPPEAVWTRSSPAATRIVRGLGRISVFRLSGPLDPRAC
jgi:hypothetical protein